MKVEQAYPPGLLLLRVVVHRDERGSFQETWRRQPYLEAGLPEFVQDNLVHSRRRVLRGLHYQLPREQGKLITVVAGEIFDVAVDVRRGSPTFGTWAGFSLSSERGIELYVPPGFAHGYVVTSETAIVSYKCSDYYDSAAEGCVSWADPGLAIDWPIRDPVLSRKDSAAPSLANISRERLPDYRG